MEARDTTTWCRQRVQLIHHAIFVHDGRLDVIPLKRALSERIEFGGRGTRVEGEVGVHRVVVGSSGSCDGS